MSLRDVFRRIGERLLRRSHSAGSNGVAPPPRDQASVPPIDQDAPLAQENWGDNPIYVHSQEAYYRNLPELLKKYARKWVAYHGDECMGLGRTETEVWNRCISRGLKPGDFYTGFICTGARYDKDEKLWDEGGEIDGQAVPESPPH